ncbi:hypothetical protein [Marinospirillum sp.]|uniref:hypothetical protein n=1 Tax=Marinospirillum sp. TaxID=2183934 RepID=UPI0025BC4644|nr:hypothetical protein [Marinospirillum sp.]
MEHLISTTSVSLIFFSLIGLFFALALAARLLNKLPAFTDYASNLLTSLGILGTFCGIVLGLWDFDSQDIDGSIASLLEGLKMAFLTSLAGMAASILYKLLTTSLTFLQPPLSEEEAEAVGPEHIYRLLQQQGTHLAHIHQALTQVDGARLTQLLERLNEQQAQLPEALAASLQEQIDPLQQLGKHQYKVLAGMQELMTQEQQTQEQARKELSESLQQAQQHLQRLNEQNEQLPHALANSLQKQIEPLLQLGEHQHKALSGIQESLSQQQQEQQQTWAAQAEREERRAEQFTAFENHLSEQLTTFGDYLSRSATEQVILALKEVISDFNNRLTEQFGENFKALDASVKRLVEWQELYREQMERLQEEFNLAAQGIEQSRESLQVIATATEPLPEYMAQLAPIITTADHQIKQLEDHLQAFADVRDAAVQAAPELQDNLERVMKAMQDSVAQANQHYEQLLTQSSKHFQQHEAHTSELLTEQKQWLDGLKQAQGKGQEQYTQWQEQLKETFEKGHKGFTERLEVMSQEQQEHFQTSFDRLASVLETATSTGAEAVQKLVNEEIQVIDQAMQKELQRVLEQMGAALAQIAGQFTQDYQKLTQQMQQIVQAQDRL